VSEHRNIGKYEVLKLLGEGGAGQVHSARDKLLNREVAIKSLRPELISDQSFVDRFMTEAKNLGRLNHPNITTLYDLIFEGQTLYMVMELVTGRTVERLLQDRHGPLPLREAQAIVSQVGDGLGYAHGLGIIHRDIKPANLMISDSGVVKIMDFGIARARGSQRHTRDGKIIGSLAYMAPEQVRGEEGDERSDLYSLAIVFYELLSGRAPFAASTDFDLMQAQINQIPERFGARIRGVPAAVENAVMQALSKNPAKRFPTVAAFCEAVGAAKAQREAISIVQASTRLVDAAEPTTPMTTVAERGGAVAAFVGGLANRARSAPAPALGVVLGGVPAALLALFVFSQGQAPSADHGPKPAFVLADKSGAPAAPPMVSVSSVVSAYDRKDYHTAFALAMRSDQSDARILYILGKSYQEGRGVTVDYAKAERYLRMAADLGNTDAAYRLAYGISKGALGAPPDKEKGREMYEKLARNGHPLSIFAIGKYYEEKGENDRAIPWYRRVVDTMVSGEDEKEAKYKAEQRLHVLEAAKR
jgi:serine/threonine-protein kinase